MPKACSWSEPPLEIDPYHWQLLSTLYDSPSDIDLYVGGLAELPHGGGIIGRTFNCIIGKQFHDVKFGDRYELASEYDEPKLA